VSFDTRIYIGRALTVERAGIEVSEEAAVRDEHMHDITEPVRENEEEKGGDQERLRLEVVDLREHGAERRESQA
jgi:hypothetical protein